MNQTTKFKKIKKNKTSKVFNQYKNVLSRATKDAPSPGSIICIGSSHLQNWKSVKKDLRPLTVYNYGVRGSSMEQAADKYVANLVIPFKPRAIIINEGSNDIYSGTSPEEILMNFRKLHGKVHSTLPKTRIYVLSIVPSPRRNPRKIELLKQANILLSNECKTQSWMNFIDITGQLIGPDGKPNKKYFKSGDIHMSSAGYVLLKSIIAPVILPAERTFEES